MGRSIPPMERERRDAINRNWAPVFDSIDRAAVLLATPHGGKNQTLAWYWVNRRCREALGDGITALAAGRYLEALPIAEQFERDAAAFMARAESIPLGERAAARRSFFRDPPDAAPKWQGAKSVPLKAPAPQYEKSGRVEAPEKANPAGRPANGVQVKQVSKQIQECRDVEKSNGNAAGPQQRTVFPSLTVIDGKITIPLQFADAEGMGLQAADFIEAARELFIDIQCEQERDCNITLAILGLRAAEAIVSHLTEIARHAPEVTP